MDQWTVEVMTKSKILVAAQDGQDAITRVQRNLPRGCGFVRYEANKLYEEDISDAILAADLVLKSNQ